MISLDFLEKVDLFQDLDDERLTAVQGCCEEVEYRRGEKLFGAGEEASNLWIVLDGQVGLQEKESGDASSAGDKPLSSLSEAGVFGWSSLAPPYRYTLSAFCDSRRCRVIKVGRDCLTGLFEKDPELGYEVMKKLLSIIGQRFELLQEEVAKRRGEELMNRW
ncbi:MAG: cyclic nucleotide-binding domain-containing protein [Deltaproteobacteria bacterium]|nr:cyclic nucleotide-binding domain-containing protein [Deltaproteobacteria bacterium]MBW2017763.1 cyclic nucleotide-binding domain-containing protein [Deltaproteobacteria bacterium]